MTRINSWRSKPDVPVLYRFTYIYFLKPTFKPNWLVGIQFQNVMLIVSCLRNVVDTKTQMDSESIWQTKCSTWNEETNDNRKANANTLFLPFKSDMEFRKKRRKKRTHPYGATRTHKEKWTRLSCSSHVDQIRADRHLICMPIVSNGRD